MESAYFEIYQKIGLGLQMEAAEKKRLQKEARLQKAASSSSQASGSNDQSARTNEKSDNSPQEGDTTQETTKRGGWLGFFTKTHDNMTENTDTGKQPSEKSST